MEPSVVHRFSDGQKHHTTETIGLAKICYTVLEGGEGCRCNKGQYTYHSDKFFFCFFLSFLSSLFISLDIFFSANFWLGKCLSTQNGMMSPHTCINSNTHTHNHHHHHHTCTLSLSHTHIHTHTHTHTNTRTYEHTHTHTHTHICTHTHIGTSKSSRPWFDSTSYLPTVI